MAEAERQPGRGELGTSGMAYLPLPSAKAAWVAALTVYLRYCLYARERALSRLACAAVIVSRGPLPPPEPRTS